MSGCLRCNWILVLCRANSAFVDPCRAQRTCGRSFCSGIEQTLLAELAQWKFGHSASPRVQEAGMCS
eukprot:3795335-Amphidinium_carterae.1